MSTDPTKYIARLTKNGREHGFVLQSSVAPSARETILYRCSRGHDVSVVRDTALRSNWKGYCEACVFEDRLGRIREIVDSLGGKILSKKTDFLTTDKIELECGSGHRWNKTVYALLEGTWCTQCVVDRRKITLDDAQKLAAKFGGRCLSEECRGSGQPLLWQCGNDHRWERSYQEQLKQTKFCSVCRIPTRRGDETTYTVAERREQTFRRVQQAAVEHGGRCLSRTYKNLQTPMQWQCAAGHRWQAPAQPILYAGAWCRICAQQSRKNAITLDTLRQFADDHGGRMLSDKYHKNTDKLLWRCSEGHEFRRSWMSMRKVDNFCPTCPPLLDFDCR